MDDISTPDVSITNERIAHLEKKVTLLMDNYEFLVLSIRELETQIENKSRRYEFEYPQSDKDYD